MREEADIKLLQQCHRQIDCSWENRPEKFEVLRLTDGDVELHGIDIFTSRNQFTPRLLDFRIFVPRPIPCDTYGPGNIQQ